MTSKKNLKELREEVESLLMSRIKTKEALTEAIPTLVAFQEAVASFGKLICECRKLKDTLADDCSKYVLEHPKAIEMSEIRDGVSSGDIVIDGEKFHLSVGPGEVKRDNGDNLVQSFLATLPKKFVSASLKLNAKDLPDESLAEYGLVRGTKCTWSKVETAGSAEDVE